MKHKAQLGSSATCSKKRNGPMTPSSASASANGGSFSACNQRKRENADVGIVVVEVVIESTDVGIVVSYVVIQDLRMQPQQTPLPHRCQPECYCCRGKNMNVNSAVEEKI